MTATVETAPEESVPTPEGAQEEPKASGGPKHRHRTVRHIAVHGGGAGVVSVAAEVLHVFGPSALGLGAAGVAAAGAGVVAVRRRRKGSRSTTRKGATVRTVRRSTKTASGTRAAAGLGRGKAGVGASGRARPAASATASRRAHPGAPGRAAGTAHRARRGNAGASASRPGRTLHRRTHKPSILSGRGASARGTASSRRPGGAKTHRGAEAHPRNIRLGNRVMRRLTRAARTKEAAQAGPGRAKPITRAGRARKKASKYGRHTARFAKRSTIRALRFAKAGGKASLPYLRLRPPSKEAEAQLKAQEEKAAAKTAEAENGKPEKAAPKTPNKRNTAQPGRALAAPGLTVKDIMTANVPSAGITAATDAITEHIAGFEPENALDIEAFLGGLDHLFTALGSSLVTVSERLGGEHPVDASVVEHVQQLGAHALTLAEYGTQSHSLFRAAHESELQRLEQPRMREEDWDVERNR